MLRGVLAAALACWSVVAGATAFTSAPGACATTCNWNAGASWTGGTGSNFPNSSGDTATISAGDFVVVPTSTTITVGAVTFVDGTGAGNESTIDIAGTLNLAGAVSMVNFAEIKGEPDGLLDLNGQTVTVSGSVSRLVLTGTSGHRFIIQSTGSRGKITTSGTPQFISTWDYVAISGLTDSVFGRSGSAAVTQHYAHCTFTDMELFFIDSTSTAVNAGFEFDHNDIRTPHTPTGTDYQPQVTMASQALGTAPRSMTFNTWAGDGSIIDSIFCNNCVGVTLTDNVIEHYRIEAGAPFLTPNRNMLYSDDPLNANDAFFLSSGGQFTTATNEYFYYNGGQHAFGSQNASANFTASVYETCAVSRCLGSNWFLYGAGFNGTLTVQTGIWIGEGTPVSFTGAAAPTVDFSNNTAYMSNNFQVDFAIGIETEQVANLTGTVNYYNNLNVDSNTTAGPEAAITLINVAGSQITLADFDGQAGYNNGGTYVTTSIPYLDNHGTTPIAGLGTHDVQANPQFKTRGCNLASWDTSLGGAGTAANAIAEMEKLNGTGGTWNTAYNVTSLLVYIRTCYTPQNVAFQGTGRSGADIGAMPVQPIVPGYGLLLGR